MGGFGSGSYARINLKQTVENGITLDLNKLFRDKVLDQNYDSAGHIIWRRTRDLSVVAKIGFYSDFLNNRSQLIYDYNGSRQDYAIELTSCRPNFGGLRWWFLCPITGKRSAKLYLKSGYATFASREALKLCYQSQRETKAQRLLYKAQNLRDKLNKNDDNMGSSIPDRPKGMHFNTYHRLIHEIEILELNGWINIKEQLR